MTYLVNRGTVTFLNNIKKQRYFKHGNSLTRMNGLDNYERNYSYNTYDIALILVRLQLLVVARIVIINIITVFSITITCDDRLK